MAKLAAIVAAVLLLLCGCGSVTQLPQEGTSTQCPDNLMEAPPDDEVDTQTDETPDDQMDNEPDAQAGDTTDVQADDEDDNQPEEIPEPTMETVMYIEIGDTTLTTSLEDNASADALKELLEKGPLTVSVSDYGGFEKVGELPQSLPRQDTRMTASAGDIMLYQGSSIVLFYGSNTWAYTKLGQITGIEEEELKAVLGSSAEQITLSLSED